MEMTCWGYLLFQKAGDQLHTKHILVLSSIIEHTVLVPNLLYAEVAKHIDNLLDIGEVLAWSDSQEPVRSKPILLKSNNASGTMWVRQFSKLGSLYNFIGPHYSTAPLSKVP